MNFFVVVSATVFAIVLSKFALRFFRFIKFVVAVNKLPGRVAYPLPIFALEMIKIKSEDRLQWYHNKLINSEKSIMTVTQSLNEAMVQIWKPHHLEVIFPSTKNITKSHIYDNLDLWLGKALLTSTGEKWLHQRKIITPAFHFGIVETFSETISEKAEILNQIIEEEIKKNPGKPIEFFSLAVRCTLHIICETAMGVKINVQRKSDSAYEIALHKVAEISVKRKHYPWLKWDWIFYRTKLGSDYKSAIHTMTNFSMQIIKKRQLTRNVDSNYLAQGDEEDDIGKRKKKTLLDLLLDVNENQEIPMTDTELREQVDTFMFAGHDTTAAAVNWAMFNLGNNPDVQEKLHEELDEVFGDSKEPATMKQLAQLNYLDQVIKENLRLNPSVPVISRRLIQNVELDGHLIPKGCNVSMVIFSLHRDPEVWPDPLKFDPDRFLPENCKGRHPYAYVPFSAGPRNCIGQKFAMAELKIVLTALLRKWKVKSAKTQAEMKMISTFILRPFEGNYIYFNPK